MRTAIRDGHVSIWFLRPEQDWLIVRRFSHLLSDQERSDERLTRSPVRLLTRIALRRAIQRVIAHGSDGSGGGGVADSALAHTSAGKPSLPGGPAFSVAHTAFVGVIAVAATRDTSIGVDLEPRSRRINMSPARRWGLMACAAHWTEAAAGRPAPAGVADVAPPDCDDPAVVRAWIVLEALAKAEGTGIGDILERCGARAPEHAQSPACQAHRAALARRYAVWFQAGPADHLCSVATAPDVPGIRVAQTVELLGGGGVRNTS